MTRRRQDNWQGEGSPSRAIREDEAVVWSSLLVCLDADLLGLAKGGRLVVWRLLPCLWPLFPGTWCDRNSTSEVGTNSLSIVWDVGGVTPEVSCSRRNRDRRCSTLPEEKW